MISWIDAPWICFCDIHAEPESKAIFLTTDGVDAALWRIILRQLGSGLAAEFGGSDPGLLMHFFNSLTIDGFNFIPSVSFSVIDADINDNAKY